MFNLLKIENEPFLSYARVCYKCGLIYIWVILGSSLEGLIYVWYMKRSKTDQVPILVILVLQTTYRIISVDLDLRTTKKNTKQTYFYCCSFVLVRIVRIRMKHWKLRCIKDVLQKIILFCVTCIWYTSLRRPTQQKKKRSLYFIFCSFKIPCACSSRGRLPLFSSWLVDWFISSL